MIGYIRGQLLDKNLESILVDVQGVGYELQISSISLEQMDLGETLQLFVHTHMREDALTLFGFLSLQEKNVFLSLLKVNGVGPKLALKILSGAPLNRLLEMIESGDVKAISSIPKVGKKTAEQLILSLKGKLTLADELKPQSNSSSNASKPQKSVLASALMNLGYRQNEVEQVLEKIDESLDFEDTLRKALGLLSGQMKWPEEAAR